MVSMTAKEATLFLCGDVMLGRGIDQILPHSCPPRLHEAYARSAIDYVRLAERANGPVPRSVEVGYVWGDALAVLDAVRPAARIINLETSITTSDTPAPKSIHYRMHPGNLPVLTVAGIDCCVLANNHVLDWGAAGLVETLETLRQGRVPAVGAGLDLESARAPVALALGGNRRVLVYAFGTTDSGIPPAWVAAAGRPGVNLIPDFSAPAVDEIGGFVERAREAGDLAVASVHWGGNWGYEIPLAHRQLAHALIDRAGFDLVHGHSSHHPKAIEIHNGHLILYGCGDFINDYEGISGYERFRDDLVVMYLPTLDLASGRLVRLEMKPLRLRNLRLNRPSKTEAIWLCRRLDRECSRFGGRVVPTDEPNTLALLAH